MEKKYEPQTSIFSEGSCGLEIFFPLCWDFADLGLWWCTIFVLILEETRDVDGDCGLITFGVS